MSSIGGFQAIQPYPETEGLNEDSVESLTPSTSAEILNIVKKELAKASQLLKASSKVQGFFANRFKIMVEHYGTKSTESNKIKAETFSKLLDLFERHQQSYGYFPLLGGSCSALCGMFMKKIQQSLSMDQSGDSITLISTAEELMNEVGKNLMLLDGAKSDNNGRNHVVNKINITILKFFQNYVNRTGISTSDIENILQVTQRLYLSLVQYQNQKGYIPSLAQSSVICGYYTETFREMKNQLMLAHITEITELAAVLVLSPQTIPPTEPVQQGMPPSIDIPAYMVTTVSAPVAPVAPVRNRERAAPLCCVLL